jgi:hypothetical protein
MSRKSYYLINKKLKIYEEDQQKIKCTFRYNPELRSYQQQETNCSSDSDRNVVENLDCVDGVLVSPSNSHASVSGSVEVNNAEHCEN